MAKVEVDPDFLRNMADATEAAMDAWASVIVTRAKENVSKPGKPTSASGLKKFRAGLADATKALRRGRSDVSQPAAVKERGRLAVGLVAAARRGVTIRKDKSIKFTDKGFTDPPGGFPRKRTGQLRRSLAFDAPEKGVRNLGSTMPYGTGYAAIHEKGGPMKGGQPYIVVFGQAVFIKKDKISTHASRVRYTKPYNMPARPYMRPAMRETVPEQSVAFNAAFKARMAELGGGTP